MLHIWGQNADGRLKTLYYKVFPNGHAVGWIDEIVEFAPLSREQIGEIVERLVAAHDLVEIAAENVDARPRRRHLQLDRDQAQVFDCA